MAKYSRQNRPEGKFYSRAKVVVDLGERHVRRALKVLGEVDSEARKSPLVVWNCPVALAITEAVTDQTGECDVRATVAGKKYWLWYGHTRLDGLTLPEFAREARQAFDGGSEVPTGLFEIRGVWE